MALPALLEEGLCSTALQDLTQFLQVDASPAWLYVSKEGNLCRSSGRKMVCAPRVGLGARSVKLVVTLTSCQSFLEREQTVHHTARGFSYTPAHLATKVVPSGLSSVPTLFALCTFHLLLLCVLKFLCVYLTFGCAGSLLSRRLFLWLWSLSLSLRWLLL